METSYGHFQIYFLEKYTSDYISLVFFSMDPLAKQIHEKYGDYSVQMIK